MPYSQTSSFELEQDAAGIDTSTPPSSPSDADVHVVGRGATGAFYLKDDWLATWNAAQGVWAFEKPIHGQRVHASGVWLEYDAVACIWKNSEVLGVAKVGLTASTTQTQGQGALAHEINVVETCANANDVRTLPPARPGRTCVVANDGAQTLQVFPASGDSIDGGAADASTTIAAGKRRHFWAKSLSGWISLLGA